MEKLTFPIPPLCEFLPPETQQTVELSNKRDEQGSNIPDFFSKMDDLYQEMHWQNRLQMKVTSYWFAKRISDWKSFAFKLAVLINVLVATTMPLERFTHPDFGNFPWFLLIVLEIIQVVNAGVTLFSYYGKLFSWCSSPVVAVV